jgi:hypothetical protein
MKKLLVLLLVLGMTSAASAGLTLSAVDGDTVSLDGDIDADIYVLVVSDGTLSPLDGTALSIPAAPTLSGYAADSSAWIGVISFPAGMTGGSWVLASAPGEAYQTGRYLTLDVAYSGQADVFAAWFNENTGGTGEIGRITVPEPMTVALLGLGGLLMLRRRK